MGDIKTIAGKYWQTNGGWPGWYSEKQQHWAKQIAKEIYHYRTVDGVQPLHGLIFEVNRDTFEHRGWQFDYSPEIAGWFDGVEFPAIQTAIKAVDAYKKLKPAQKQEALKTHEILPVGHKDCDKFCGFKQYCPDNKF